MEKRFCYLCIDGASSVIEAQVINHLELVHDTDPGLSFDLFLLARADEAEDSSLFDPLRKDELERRIGGRVIARTFNTVPSGFFLTLWQLLRYTFPACFTRGLIIHPRALDGSFMAACFKWICLGLPRVICDERDDALSEYLFDFSASGGSLKSLSFRFQYLKKFFMEWFSSLSATRILYVSSALRGVMEERFPFLPKKFGGVFPSLCDERKFFFDKELRREKRKELGLFSEQQTLIYVGGVESYQHFDVMADLFKVCHRARNDMFFLFITRKRNHQVVHESLGKILPHGSYLVAELPHEEVCEIMNAADMGILLREPSDASIGASPVKFAEYLLCGLPVLLPEGIGDYSGLVKDENMGVVAENLTDIDGMAKNCIRYMDEHPDEKNRERIASIARAHLSRQSRIPDYISFYRSL